MSFGVCFAVTAGVGAWLFSFETLPPLPKSKVVKSNLEQKLGGKKQTAKAVERTFKPTVQSSLLASNRPLNIVIEPGSQNAPVPVHTGKIDLIVTAAGLRMRSEPSSRSVQVGNYTRGARFVHIKDDQGWALVQSLDDGKKGWMFKKYMGKGG